MQKVPPPPAAARRRRRRRHRRRRHRQRVLVVASLSSVRTVVVDAGRRVARAQPSHPPSVSLPDPVVILTHGGGQTSGC